MQVNYDPEKDTLKIVLSSTPVKKCEYDNPGIILGYGGDGTLVDVEIPEASRRVDDPKSVDLCVRGRNVQGMKLL
ncbi:DUF2283 domain-containing protein [Desulfovibrio ferrophilus]|uniref:DUF2283 domain-containing protein n=1 Tax=Desulfovibrio ferrophilus TaxID=241368 RepID=A0A2Z6B2I4_9BACT|nr:DUF2283 domain-containing protein [Desulfovibrio ferrophilus]BBD09734.1 uncharacterized protein DFE_3008 [Desulfovibrio ferrophilus]